VEHSAAELKSIVTGWLGSLADQTLVREKKKTTVIARTLKRSGEVTYQQASKLGVTLGSRG
jgi:hypothetical protein